MDINVHLGINENSDKCILKDLNLGLAWSIYSRAGKNLRFFKKVFRFFRFLGFNVRTVAGGTIDTRIRSRRKLYTRRLTHALLC